MLKIRCILCILRLITKIRRKRNKRTNSNAKVRNFPLNQNFSAIILTCSRTRSRCSSATKQKPPTNILILKDKETLRNLDNRAMPRFEHTSRILFARKTKLVPPTGPRLFLTCNCSPMQFSFFELALFAEKENEKRMNRTFLRARVVKRYEKTEEAEEHRGGDRKNSISSLRRGKDSRRIPEKYAFSAFSGISSFFCLFVEPKMECWLSI